MRMDLKIALTAATVLPQAEAKKPSRPSLMSGAGRLVRNHVGPICCYILFTCVVSLAVLPVKDLLAERAKQLAKRLPQQIVFLVSEVGEAVAPAR